MNTKKNRLLSNNAGRTILETTKPVPDPVQATVPNRRSLLLASVVSCVLGVIRVSAADRERRINARISNPGKLKFTPFTCYDATEQLDLTATLRSRHEGCVDPAVSGGRRVGKASVPARHEYVWLVRVQQRVQRRI